jgi:hypothetical protein
MDNSNGKNRQKWFVTIIASLLIVVSTFYRLVNGMEADKTVCTVFMFIAGLPWGANIIDFIRKK